jgi:flagellar basal body-associated protein FliL
MADKPEKKDAAGEAATAGKKNATSLLAKTPVLLGGVMLIEAAVLFAGFKVFGGGAPKSASGAELAEHDPHGDGHGEGKAADKKKIVELHVVDDFRALNKANGHTYFFDVSIVVLSKTESADKIKQTIEDRGALIRDRIRTIIAQSDPEKLVGGAEPGLETFRRQVKYQLDEIIGDGMIEEVLVPKCIFRAEY